MLVKWKVEFYDSKVLVSIKKWPIGIKAKFIHIVELIEALGLTDVGMPHVKSLAAGLFGVRAKALKVLAVHYFATYGDVL